MIYDIYNIYNVDFFIKKFEAIPANLWTIQKFQRGDGTCCAMGHCGMDEDGDGGVWNTPEGSALNHLFRDARLNVADVNDGTNMQFQQDNPRDRMLAALRWIKENHPNV